MFVMLGRRVIVSVGGNDETYETDERFILQFPSVTNRKPLCHVVYDCLDDSTPCVVRFYLGGREQCSSVLLHARRTGRS